MVKMGIKAVVRVQIDLVVKVILDLVMDKTIRKIIIIVWEPKKIKGEDGEVDSLV